MNGAIRPKKGLVWQEKDKPIGPIGTVSMKDGSLMSEKLYKELLDGLAAPNPYLSYTPHEHKKSRISKWRSRFLDVTKTFLIGLGAILLAVAPFVVIGLLFGGMAVIYAFFGLAFGFLAGFIVFMLGFLIREIRDGRL